MNGSFRGKVAVVSQIPSRNGTLGLATRGVAVGWLKKKGQRVDFWKKKAVETERCLNAILRYEKACDLRSLVDEATGAMLVSMRVVWEPTGSWPTCLQL